MVEAREKARAKTIRRRGGKGWNEEMK